MMMKRVVGCFLCLEMQQLLEQVYAVLGVLMGMYLGQLNGIWRGRGRPIVQLAS